MKPHLSKGEWRGHTAEQQVGWERQLWLSLEYAICYTYIMLLSQPKFLCPGRLSLEKSLRNGIKKRMEINIIKSFPGARRKDMNKSMTFDVCCKWIASTIGETSTCCESAWRRQRNNQSRHHTSD